VVFLFLEIKSNPVTIFHINEVLPDSDNFCIEILSFNVETLNGCYLTSLTDTVNFREGISINHEFIKITNDSLERSFSVNPVQDIITLWSSEEYILDKISYGYDDNE
jgi:hypothetical protein